ncbi:MAG TPA: transposase [Gaiellaceae bacterium]|nr:transposase [Gaiellaceae bacterium]
MDETSVGGKPRQSHRREAAEKGWDVRMAHWDPKAIVFGAVERGGKVRATVVPNSRGHVPRNQAREYVLPESTIYADQYEGYRKLGDKYRHRRINHSARVYVEGDTHTQTIEGFWSLTKKNEYAWRYTTATTRARCSGCSCSARRLVEDSVGRSPAGAHPGRQAPSDGRDIGCSFGYPISLRDSGDRPTFLAVDECLFAAVGSRPLPQALIVGAVILVVGTLAKWAYRKYTKRPSDDD